MEPYQLNSIKYLGSSTLLTQKTSSLIILTMMEVDQVRERERGGGGDCFYTSIVSVYFLGAYLYYYSPGVAVSRFGGGHIIPLPSSVGQ